MAEEQFQETLVEEGRRRLPPILEEDSVWWQGGEVTHTK